MNEKDKEVIAEKIYKKSEENRKRHFAFWVLFLAVFLALQVMAFTLSIAIAQFGLLLYSLSYMSMFLEIIL